jgi:hypothetical protein
VFVVGPAGRPDHEHSRAVTPARPRTQQVRHHVTKVKPEAATPAKALLKMGGETPETCWAINKRQDNKLKNCRITLFELNVKLRCQKDKYVDSSFIDCGRPFDWNVCLLAFIAIFASTDIQPVSLWMHADMPAAVDWTCPLLPCDWRVLISDWALGEGMWALEDCAVGTGYKMLFGS